MPSLSSSFFAYCDPQGRASSASSCFLTSLFSLSPLPSLSLPVIKNQNQIRYELPSPGNVRAARTVADLEAAVAGTFPPSSNNNASDTSSSSRLTVLEFYVPACPACRSLAPKLRQLAADNPDVDFVTVNGEASAEE